MGDKVLKERGKEGGQKTDMRRIYAVQNFFFPLHRLDRKILGCSDKKQEHKYEILDDQ